MTDPLFSDDLTFPTGPAEQPKTGPATSGDTALCYEDQVHALFNELALTLELLPRDALRAYFRDTFCDPATSNSLPTDDMIAKAQYCYYYHYAPRPPQKVIAEFQALQRTLDNPPSRLLEVRDTQSRLLFKLRLLAASLGNVNVSTPTGTRIAAVRHDLDTMFKLFGMSE